MISFLKVTLTSLGTSVRTLLAQVRGAGATGDDDHAEPMDKVEVNNPIGFDSRPMLTDTTELITFRLGPQVVGLYIIDKGRSDKLGDSPSLEEGETRVSGAKETSAMLRARADGTIAMIPKGGKTANIGGESALQPMLMGDDVTAKINEMITAINANRADHSTVKPHVHPYDKATATGVGVGTTYASTDSGASSSLTGLPTASHVDNAPAQSTKAKNA